MGLALVQGFKGLYQDLQVRAEGQELIISGPSSVDTEHFRKNHLPNLSQQLVKYGFPHLTCQVQHSDELTQQQAENFQAENDKIVQAANEEALKAMESLQQMAPPPEEKPAYDFHLARLRLNQSWIKQRLPL